MEAPNKKALIGLMPAFFVGAIAIVASAFIGQPAIQSALGAVIVAGVVTMAWRTAAVMERAAAQEVLAAAKPVFVQRLTGDRRRPTMDRETGLLADWYFRLRVEEEIARAERYGQKFTLLRITHAVEDDRRSVSLAARTCLRAIDLAGNVGSTAAILLPNTGKAGAQTVVDRLHDLLPAAEIAVSECPTDASTLAGLLDEQEWTVREDGEEQSAA